MTNQEERLITRERLEEIILCIYNIAKRNTDKNYPENSYYGTWQSLPIAKPLDYGAVKECNFKAISRGAIFSILTGCGQLYNDTPNSMNDVGTWVYCPHCGGKLNEVQLNALEGIKL